MGGIIPSMKRLIKLCLGKSKRNKMGVAIIFSIISFTISIVPYYMVYRVVVELTKSSPAMSQIINYAGITLLAIIIRATSFGVATNMSHKVAFEILYKLRVEIARKLLTLPLGYFSNNDLGATKKVINEDVEKLELFIAHSVPEIIGALTLPIATTIFLFFMDWRMGLATVAIIPIIFTLYSLTFKNSNKLIPKYNELLAKMNTAIIEYTNGMQVIKAFGLTASSYKKLSDACLGYSKFEVDWGKTFYKYTNMIKVLVSSGVVIVFPVGMFFYITGTLSIGMFMLCLLIGQGYSKPLVKLVSFMLRFNQVAQGEKKIYALLSEKSLPEPKLPKNPDNYTIEFKDVNFAYEERKILNKVSFIAKQNEITALVGHSGAGKTTIARLLPRFWDVDTGEIKIGGINIKNISNTKLMDLVSFVFQDVFLFNISIKDNIKFGKDGASDEEIVAAAKAAQCHDFVTKLPFAYDTVVGARGAKLSGGEKQRIALARAILKDAPIIIFDEATSATDPENEDKIQLAISKLIKDKTVIVIAHNLSTIVEANKIVLLENGRIVKHGKHPELLKESSIYKKMWETHIKSNQLIAYGGEANG